MAKHSYPEKPVSCKGCPWYGDGTGFVPDEPNKGAKVLFLGAKPSESDQLSGSAFSGRSSKMIERSIEKYGVKRTECHWCHVVKCRRENKPGFVDYNAAAEFCRKANPLPVPPKIVVPLDDESLMVAANLLEVETWRGSPITDATGYGNGTLVIPTPHPNFIFNQPRMRTASKSDFARICRAAVRGPGFLHYEDAFKTAMECSSFIELFGDLAKQDIFIALDVETTMAKPIDNEMKIFGIGWARDRAANINWEMLSETEHAQLKDIVANAHCKFVTATPFDFSVLSKYGYKFRWPNCHDLTLLHSRYDIELPHTLEFIASMWTYRKYWKNLAHSEPYYYNCLDNAGEWEAFDKIRRYCQENDPGVLEVYEKDRRHIRTAVKLHLNGMPLDKEVFKSERKVYVKLRNELEAELVGEFTKDKPKMEEPEKCPKHPRYVGKTPLKLRKKEEVLCESCLKVRDYFTAQTPLNLRARSQMISLLKGEGKVLPTKGRGAKAKVSLDKGAIEKLAVKYNDPRMFKLLEFKKRDTVVVRYYRDAKTSPKTGRVHATFSMHSAMHRWHCTKPNQQQVKRPEDLIVVDPETGEERKELHGPRLAYVPDAGKVFLGFDGDGLHYRIAGCLSKDPFINETLSRYDRTGALEHKPHIVNCMALFHVSADQAITWMHEKASQYTFAKNFIYMLLNGGTVPALHLAAVTAGLKLDVPEVKKLMDNWLEAAHYYRAWRESLLHQAETSGIVTLTDGRRRRFYNLRWKEGKWNAGPDEVKEIYNLPLIGTEVSYVNPRVEKVLDLCETTAMAWELILYDHDGFMLHGPESEAIAMTQEIMPMLEKPENLGKGMILTVPWQPTKGLSWAKMKEFEWKESRGRVPVAVL
jgi:uracil-DNA glycosylase